MVDQTAGSSSLRVASWNVALGADLELLMAGQSASDGPALPRGADVPRPAERVDAIAAAIAAGRPDVIGLQEIGTWQARRDNHTVESWNYDEMLMDALLGAGEPYVMLFCGETFTASLALDGGGSVYFSSCDAIALRATLERPITVLDAAHGTFDARGTVTGVGLVDDLEVVSGWVRVDLEVGGRHVRIISTHLDPTDALVRRKQAHELVSIASPSPYPVVLLGDLSVQVGDQVLDAIAAGGFAAAGSGSLGDARRQHVFVDPYALDAGPVRLLGPTCEQPAAGGADADRVDAGVIADVLLW